MECIQFFDIQDTTEYILQINPEYYIKPYVGDHIITQGYKYKVIEVCIDYDNDGKCNVFLEKIYRIES